MARRTPGFRHCADALGGKSGRGRRVGEEVARPVPSNREHVVAGEAELRPCARLDQKLADDRVSALFGMGVVARRALNLSAGVVVDRVARGGGVGSSTGGRTNGDGVAATKVGSYV